VRLGEYFKYKGLNFEAAFTGTLQRQTKTFAGICEGMGVAMDAERSDGPPLASSAPLHGARGSETPKAHEVASVGAHTVCPGLNEYDSAAVIGAIHPHKLEKPTSPEMYRSHFRLLKDGLAQWMAGVVSPQGMPSYSEFVTGITDVLDHVRKSHTGNVLLVSSGGPISTAVGHVLGTAPEITIELNLRIRNCSVTEFAFTPKRHMLVTYNTLPHLDAPEHASWITYA